jgi:hypothetical protein
MSGYVDVRRLRPIPQQPGRQSQIPKHLHRLVSLLMPLVSGLILFARLARSASASGSPTSRMILLSRTQFAGRVL